MKMYSAIINVAKKAIFELQVYHAEAECPRCTVICQYCCFLTEYQFIDDHRSY